MTATPGVWFHGSPQTHLPVLKLGQEVAGTTPPQTLGKRGVYFTQDRAYAQVYAGERGRVYEVELVTANPLTVDRANWPDGNLTPSFVADLFNRASAGGHECILIPHIFEAVVLDLRSIRYRSAMVPALPTRTPGLFYRGCSDHRDTLGGTVYTRSREWALANAWPAGGVSTVDLITTNPFTIRERLPEFLLRPLLQQAVQLGCDCAVFQDSGDLVVFDARCVRRLDMDKN
jgi:hypothetical protein